MGGEARGARGGESAIRAREKEVKTKLARLAKKSSFKGQSPASMSMPKLRSTENKIKKKIKMRVNVKRAHKARKQARASLRRAGKPVPLSLKRGKLTSKSVKKAIPRSAKAKVAKA